MKLLLIISALLLIGCSKEVPTPINPLAGTNWRGPKPMGPNLIEFTNDSMFEYIDSTDLLYYSGYTIKNNSIFVIGNYISDWGKKSRYDTTYTATFRISNDSLFLNNQFRGTRY